MYPYFRVARVLARAAFKPRLDLEEMIGHPTTREEE